VNVAVPLGPTIFDRMIAEHGKRRHVRDQVLTGASEARNGNLTVLARSFLENHRDEFIRHFDELEEVSPEGVFAAIEAAFHIGECMAATRFREEVPRVHMRDNAANARRERAKKPRSPKVLALLEAVRNAMEANHAKPNGG
jgi:hypothetical protein